MTECLLNRGPCPMPWHVAGSGKSEALARKIRRCGRLVRLKFSKCAGRPSARTSPPVPEQASGRRHCHAPKPPRPAAPTPDPSPRGGGSKQRPELSPPPLWGRVRVGARAVRRGRRGKQGRTGPTKKGRARGPSRCGFEGRKPVAQGRCTNLERSLRGAAYLCGGCGGARGIAKRGTRLPGSPAPAP